MTTSLQDLKAQQASLAKAMAEHEKPLLESAQDALKGWATVELVDKLTAIRDELPDGQGKTQIGNVLTVLNAVPQVLAQELARVDGLAAPAPAPMMYQPAPIQPQEDAA